MNLRTSLLTITLLIYCSSNAQLKNAFLQVFENTPSSTIAKHTQKFTDSLGNQTELPVVIMKGQATGKTLTILAGVHGYEYPPIMAVQAFMKEIKPENLDGTIIILPISNTAAFYGRSLYINPLDNKNLNNAFPGKANGTVTEQIADFITRRIIPLSDVFLDIHGGDANEDLTPFVCYYDNRKKSVQTTMAKKLSEVSGFPNIVSYPYTISDTEPAKYAFKQAVQEGKVGLSFEAGKLGNVQEDAVLLNRDGIFNVLGALDMYSKASTAPARLRRYNNQVYIKVPSTGILHSSIKAGDMLQKGQKIGYITNEFGETLDEIYASASGLVLYKISTPPVKKGETLLCIAIPGD